MNCPNENPIWPPLSYSVVSFKKNDFDDPNVKINNLVEDGFSCITIIPTYTVKTKESKLTYKSDGKDKHFREILSVETAKTPSLEQIKALMVEAIKKGLHVKLEPHIDADILGGAGETYWRAFLYFDPSKLLPDSPSYFDMILQPLMKLVVELKDTPVENFPNCKPCFSFTLGSELEMSVIGFPESWLSVLKKLQTQRSGAQIEQRLDFGHKINFDHAKRTKTWLEYIHTMEQKPAPTNNDVKKQAGREGNYYAVLDYLSLSFYPNMQKTKISEAEWKETPSKEKTNKITDEFEIQFNQSCGPFSGLPNVTPEIGEFGLGSTDISRPWSGENSNSLNTPEGKNVRLNYFLGFLQFLKKHASSFKRKRQSCFVFSPATFWAVGTFDPLMDDDLKKHIKEFNSQNHGDESKKTKEEPDEKKTTPSIPPKDESPRSLKNVWKIIGGIIGAGIIIGIIIWYFI